MPKDQGLLLECGCGSATWYVRDEFTVTLGAATSAGDHRPVPETVKAVTRCTTCGQTMQDAVAQL